MNWLHSRTFKVISIVVLVFFLWTFGGVFDVAQAISNSAEVKNSPIVHSQKSQVKKPEDKFQKTIEDIEKVLTDTVTDTDTKKSKLRSKKLEVENRDTEIKKQFKETDEKIKGLPEVIKQRHRDFVKKYEENLKELNANLDAIEKAKTEVEVNAQIDKTKAFLEKVKPPKKHTPLDPNNLPHRTAEPEWIEPRTSPKQFEKDGGEGLAGRGQEEFSAEARKSKSAKAFPTLEKGGKGGFDKPILVASNGSLAGILSDSSKYSVNAVIPAKAGIQGFGYPIETFGYDKLNNSSIGAADYGTLALGDSGTMLLALAVPPSSADLTETIEVQFTPEIQAKAAELGHNPVKIYNWVRNNIEFVPTYGSIQGANMCLQTKLCNDMDTASLLIALLRTSGIHAKYVYGTIELPIEKVKNWAGGFTDTNAAMTFIASGGIPVGGVTSGGSIVSVQMEHIWTEAWIDMIPSQGAVHKQGDTWIPLDASFKQYNYVQGMDIKSAVPFDAQSFIDQIKSTATINETEGYVTNVSSSLIQQTMTDYQTRVQDYITQNYPDATVGDVLGKKEIIKQEFRVLLGTLPYKTIAVGTKYSNLPDSLRHKVTFSMTSDNIYYDPQPLSITKALPEIAGKKITLSYSPATQADENVINSYLPKPHTDGTPIQPSELPSSLPVYLISLKPELHIDGAVVAAGGAIGMGEIEDFAITIRPPNLSAQVVNNKVIAGEYNAVAIDVARITAEQMTAIKTKLEAIRAKLEAQNFEGLTKEDILGDILYTAVFSYFAELDVMDYVASRTMKVTSIRLPSVGRFFNALLVDYVFSMPVSASSGGLSMDIGLIRKLVRTSDGTKDKQIQFMLNSGAYSSALEHGIPEQLFSTPENPVQGISAVKALQIANEQGIPIYTINKSNINTILPQLQIDADVKADIQNAVNAGKEVTVSKTNIIFNGWTGCGYIIVDPTTGAGAYMISGGMNGAVVILTMLLAICFFVLAAFVGWALVAILAVSTVVAALVAIFFMLVGFLLVFIEAGIATESSDKAFDYTKCMGIAAAEHAAIHALLNKLPETWRKTLLELLGDFIGSYDINECFQELKE